MSTVTDTDLKELKDLINSKFDQVDRKLEKLSEDVNDIKVEIATIKEGLNSVNKRIDDTQLAINKRIDNLDFLARTVIGGIVLALLAGLTKILYPNIIN